MPRIAILIGHWLFWEKVIRILKYSTRKSLMIEVCLEFKCTTAIRIPGNSELGGCDFKTWWRYIFWTKMWFIKLSQLACSIELVVLTVSIGWVYPELPWKPIFGFYYSWWYLIIIIHLFLLSKEDFTLQKINGAISWKRTRE